MSSNLTAKLGDLDYSDYNLKELVENKEYNNAIKRFIQ